MAQVKGIKVVSKREQFRRAGYVFGSEPVSIPLAKLSKDQEQSIRTDGMLVVVDADIEPKADK